MFGKGANYLGNGVVWGVNDNFYSPFTSFYNQNAVGGKVAPTFASLFHQRIYAMKFIQTFAFFTFIQCCVACQQAPENAPSVATANVPSSSLYAQEFMTPKFTATNLIFKSANIGQNWQDISAGLPVDKGVDGLIQNGEIILSNPDGVFRSKCASATPTWEKEMLLSNPVFGLFTGPSGLYALSSDNKFLHKNTTGTWVPVFSIPQKQHLRMVHETLNGTLFMGTDTGLFKSTDQGKNWKQVHNDGWVIRMTESNGVLICTNQSGILRSADGGEHWELVISEGGVGIEVETIGSGFAAITYNTESETRRVRISTDGGVTWEAIDANLPPSADIASIKQVGQYFFCGHPKGVYRSSDGGVTWELVFPAIDDKVFHLHVWGDVLYAIPRVAGC
jgi:hypothetical protein